ncbi:dioxygenase [Actinospica durhamensis]|uniref:Dioxygenase n=1 Tax=Actinospica durhamensis TaxID=1508375 RepID=A0A941EQA9_9ACTN|nr:class III extradiol ring-cleavage dioxygenase [Actinospica durhamensis]MBR7834558.1 dioxygenase [Actinospica durhamensis]
MTSTERMPTVFLSHGGPTLLEDAEWTRQLADWGERLPRPKAVLMVSAHWEQAPLAIGATDVRPLIYDFWGFPDEYYRLKYPAPGAPELAERVRKLLRGPGMPVHDLPDRGLDHGAFIPLLELYPRADVPVLQISMPTLDPQALLEIGRKLAPLRDEGYLIVSSGSFTHNLRALNPNGVAPRPLAEFDAWGRAALESGDVDAILDFRRKAPAAKFAHPREEHFVPLAVTLGTALDEIAKPQQVIEGTWMGLSKRSIQFG